MIWTNIEQMMEIYDGRLYDPECQSWIIRHDESNNGHIAYDLWSSNTGIDIVKDLSYLYNVGYKDTTIYMYMHKKRIDI